ncbi:hypothetical protein GA0115234_1016180 [Streptomyces sp. DvalAA-43]|nr:hypothetical protein GA0115234_1016180 [Streptomyces sp. DvalAA-43]
MVFLRKGRGSSKAAPAYVSSMPTCTCRETGQAGARRRRLGVIAALGITGCFALYAEPFPWDFVLSVLVALILRG